MVLIGHSMGGLLAKLMVQDSQSLLWEGISDQPASRLDGSPEAREMLRQAVFFKPVPGVRRIIFIATPHRGSRLDRVRSTHLERDSSGMRTPCCTPMRHS